jgi:hypothetical protein
MRYGIGIWVTLNKFLGELIIQKSYLISHIS